MIRNSELESYLLQCGVDWTVLEAERHIALAHEWETIYQPAFAENGRYRTGARALEEYHRQSASQFVIVPFLGNSAGPHDLRKRDPRSSAYECHAQSLPDLTAFKNIDFFVAPPDLSWTLVHTHEDHGYGGPYFIEREMLVPPTRKRKW